MFSYLKIIHLSETDATGFLFFAHQFKFSVEAFESFLQKNGFTLVEMLEKTPYRLPIIHAEADYLAPIKVGDMLDVQLSLDTIGTSSFTLNTKFIKAGIEVGKTKIVHVCISVKTGESTPIPEFILTLLQKL